MKSTNSKKLTSLYIMKLEVSKEEVDAQKHGNKQKQDRYPNINTHIFLHLFCVCVLKDETFKLKKCEENNKTILNLFFKVHNERI